MKVYRKRKGLRVKAKKSDIVVEEVNASLCWELDFKSNKKGLSDERT